MWIGLGLGLLLLAVLWLRSARSESGLTRLMTRGNGYLEKNDATNAIAAYTQAVELAPANLDVRLDLANAFLMAGDCSNVVQECQQALSLDHNSAAAYYLMGCAYLRSNHPGPAVQALEQSKQIDNAVTAVHFQLGLAQARLGHFEDAISEFETIVRFEPDHPSVHYQLSQLYQRTGRAADAEREMQKHQQVLAKNPGGAGDPAAFERCKYTQPRMAFALEQPDRRGVTVHFTDATAAAFAQAANYHGPMAVLDYNHDGRNSLFVMEGEKGFRVLDNQKGRFEPLGPILPAKPGATYRRCLVGDMNNGRFEDVIVLGEQASHAFKFATNGQARDFTAFTGLKDLKARDGVLADLNFTGKLDLLAVLPGGSGLRVYENLGNFYLQEKTAESGLPAVFPGAEQVALEDWNNEDVPGVFVTRTGQPPAFFPKQRAGSFLETNTPPDWPIGSVIATGDLNNDLRADLVVAGAKDLTIIYGGLKEQQTLPLNGLQVKGILLVDYDNDGWLDVIAYGNGAAGLAESGPGRIYRRYGHPWPGQNRPGGRTGGG